MLPIELITEVIRELGDDKKALAAVASLNKSWRQLCLPYLFERVEVKSIQPGVLFSFLIFAEGNAHIRAHIKHFVLCPSDPQSADTLVIMDQLEVFKRVLACLRSLQTVTLKHVWFKDCRGWLPEDFLGDPSHECINRDGPYPLSMLIIDGCLAGPWGSLDELHGLFAGILPLFRVRTIWFRSFCELREMPPTVATREIIRKRPASIRGVENLVLRPASSREYTREIVNGLRTKLKPDILRTLFLVQASKTLVKAAGRLILERGTSLVGLSLDVACIDGQYLENTPEFWRVLQMSKCPNLRILAFHIVIQCTQMLETVTCTGTELCHALAHLLAVTPSTLRKLIVNLRIEAPPSLPKIGPAELASISDFFAIESALLAPGFPHLEGVVQPFSNLQPRTPLL
ncbi:hypothetical protein BC628DRAFT_1423815 [Trametes gibbosa]|nr:hypothetical protein BC628DRAFT_1423815 [Trametes gibbosa]